MLVIPAPATLLTNCRRDIVMKILPGTLRLMIGFFIAWAIYPMEAVNDQVITTRRNGVVPISPSPLAAALFWCSAIVGPAWQDR
jgi:hypothetical protein